LLTACCLLPPAAPEGEAKASLLVLMREWLQEKVAMADKVLVEHAVTKVYDGDVILTYAYSQVGAEAHVHMCMHMRYVLGMYVLHSATHTRHSQLPGDMC
jgi:hypothetical protein